VLKFKNISGSAVEAIRDERRPVDVDETIEVSGVLVTSRPEPKEGDPESAPIPDDAYLVDNQGVERAWPRATWELVEDKPKAAVKADAKVEKEN
jgi:hypothetical protein